MSNYANTGTVWMTATSNTSSGSFGNYINFSSAKVVEAKNETAEQWLRRRVEEICNEGENITSKN